MACLSNIYYVFGWHSVWTCVCLPSHMSKWMLFIFEVFVRHFALRIGLVSSGSQTGVIAAGMSVFGINYLWGCRYNHHFVFFFFLSIFDFASPNRVRSTAFGGWHPKANIRDDEPIHNLLFIQFCPNKSTSAYVMVKVIDHSHEQCQSDFDYFDFLNFYKFFFLLNGIHSFDFLRENQFSAQKCFQSIWFSFLSNLE